MFGQQPLRALFTKSKFFGRTCDPRVAGSNLVRANFVLPSSVVHGDPVFEITFMTEGKKQTRKTLKTTTFTVTTLHLLTQQKITIF